MTTVKTEAAFLGGPWIADDTRGRGNNLLRVVDGQGRGVARVNATLHAEANARLIAAAPELYEALARVRVWIEGIAEHEVGGSSVNVTAAQTDLVVLDAALAKARGDALSSKG